MLYKWVEFFKTESNFIHTGNVVVIKAIPFFPHPLPSIEEVTQN